MELAVSSKGEVIYDSRGFKVEYTVTYMTSMCCGENSNTLGDQALHGNPVAVKPKDWQNRMCEVVVGEKEKDSRESVCKRSD
jgi:hypothetical protein